MKFFLLLLMPFFMCSIHAQQVKFGVKTGLNLANLTGNDTDDLKTRTSFHFGGLAEIMISDKFSLQPELLYASQGSKMEYESMYSVEESTIKLDYLNLPLMAKYYIDDRLSLEFGPQIGLLLNAEIESEFTDKEDPSFNDSETVDVTDEFKTLDIGVNFGIGYSLESGLSFGARYNLGLLNILDIDDSGSNDLKNSIFSFSIAYFF